MKLFLWGYLKIVYFPWLWIEINIHWTCFQYYIWWSKTKTLDYKDFLSVFHLLSNKLSKLTQRISFVINQRLLDWREGGILEMKVYAARTDITEELWHQMQRFVSKIKCTPWIFESLWVLFSYGAELYLWIKMPLASASCKKL
jgi:hypothetical protein